MVGIKKWIDHPRLILFNYLHMESILATIIANTPLPYMLTRKTCEHRTGIRFNPKANYDYLLFLSLVSNAFFRATEVVIVSLYTLNVPTLRLFSDKVPDTRRRYKFFSGVNLQSYFDKGTNEWLRKAGLYSAHGLSLST